MSELITIPGAEQNPYVAIGARYDYAKPTACPSCKREACGIPWGAWFHGDCGCLAVVADGRAFVPAGVDHCEFTALAPPMVKP